MINDRHHTLVWLCTLTSFTRVRSSISANAHNFIKSQLLQDLHFHSFHPRECSGMVVGFSPHRRIHGWCVCVRDVASQKALSEQQRTGETCYPPGKVAPASAITDLQPDQGSIPVNLCQSTVIITFTAWTSENDHRPSLTSSFRRDPEIGREAHT